MAFPHQKLSPSPSPSPSPSLLKPLMSPSDPSPPVPAPSRPLKLPRPNPNSQHSLIQLKQRILTAMAKLEDRDTHQIASEELEKIVEAIPPSSDCVSVCLSCFYDSDIHQKSVVKKECVKLFASLASLHSDLVIPHVGKIIASIMRRLRDPDSSVRDACVETMSTLSSHLLPSSSSSSLQEKENGSENGSHLVHKDNGSSNLIKRDNVSNGSSNLVKKENSSNGSSQLTQKENGSSHLVPIITISTFSKPLFDALSEQNKGVQTGAAMCLAGVIESAKNPPISAMARLCPRVGKLLSNPNFLARPAILGVIGSLSQVGALGQQQLAILMPCLYEALENSDWATRKASAETLSRIGSNLGSTLAFYKSKTLCALESCRFDKVKPVRDSVHDAIQLWKTLPGSGPDSPISADNSDGPELSLAMQKLELHTPVSGGVNKNEEQVSSLEKPLEAVKKRAPSLIDKKLNPEFFQKLATEIEVAVPHNSPPSISQESENNLFEQGKEIKSGGQNGDELNNDSCSILCMSEKANEESNWQFIHNRLVQIEQQQSTLMQMIQHIMVSSEQNNTVLQERIRELENELGVSSGNKFSIGVKEHYGNNDGVRSSKNFDSSRLFSDRIPTPQVVKKTYMHFEDSIHEDVDETMHRGPLGKIGGAYMLNGYATSTSHLSNIDMEGSGNEHIGKRRVWDRIPRPVKLGEGPSARSVWQASKDEITLAAIRGIRDSVELSNLNDVAASSRTGSGTEGKVYKNTTMSMNGQRKGQYSNTGSSVMDLVHVGDMEGAYRQVLSTEDEFALVRLMSRTGPVLDKFTYVTAAHVLSVAGQFLQQHSYGEVCLSWIQQVADMVANNGADCLGLSLATKRGILQGLQESTSMDLPKGWRGNTPEEILQQLAHAWSMDA